MDYFGLPTVASIQSERLIVRQLQMYLVESKGGAIACMLLALSFLGTWPALLALLERRGRLPQHTYLDYTITNLLAAIIIAFTFDEIGNQTPNFLDQLSQNYWPSVLFTMGGGIFLSLGNLATQYAWAFVGLSVTEVMTSSITVVIGTMNFVISLNNIELLDGKINKAEILFPGVGCFLTAVCFSTAVHSSNADDNKAKLAIYSADSKGAAVYAISRPNIHLENKLSFYSDKNASKETNGNKDLENGGDKPKYGTANFLIELENKRAIKVCFLLSSKEKYTYTISKTKYTDARGCCRCPHGISRSPEVVTKAGLYTRCIASCSREKCSGDDQDWENFH
ncbi:hypothetical protein SASPL_110429 [Salvia splendens]|uniref:Ureide permease n=1 Tax=Salvia splendens TaxID=180675 RepID=A0A8X9A473_SALSN|nr:hypothetical protein SASPL_110429 [Salvia splendens]